MHFTLECVAGEQMPQIRHQDILHKYSVGTRIKNKTCRPIGFHSLEKSIVLENLFEHMNGPLYIGGTMQFKLLVQDKKVWVQFGNCKELIKTDYYPIR